MATNLNGLEPLPFCPIPGKFDLNTYLPGSSDYEIMARVVETYNNAVEKFNKLLSISEDPLKYFEEFKEQYNNDWNRFKNEQQTLINSIQTSLANISTDVEDLKNGNYIDNYIPALSHWIDTNLQSMVERIVKYVFFGITDDGYFVAYIPSSWNFIDFDTDINPDSEDYGKLQLMWEPEA